MEEEKKAIELCKTYQQEKIEKELQKGKNPNLMKQILMMDFEQIEECKAKIRKEEFTPKEEIEQIPYTDGNKLTEEERKHYEKIGTEIIAKGHYSVVTMAGGQRNKAGAFRSKRYLSDKNRAKAKILI